MVGYVLVLLPLLALTSCDDSSGNRRVTNADEPAQSQGGTTSVSVVSISNYNSAMSELIVTGKQIVDDYDALLKIWNATYNIDFATTETKMLDNRVRTLLGSAKALAPPRNQVKAHATFIEAFTVLRAVFGYSLTYFNSQGVDQQALLNANIKIQEFNKLLQRYDQENG